MTDEAPVIRDRQAWRVAVREACDRLAPAWPLDASLAVNPYFGLRHLDFEEAVLTLMRVAGSTLTMPRRYYREQIESGRITRGDVAEALAAHGLPSDEQYAARLLAHDGAPPVQRIPLVLHVLGRVDPSRPWAAFCVETISRFAAAYFDTGQAVWPLPWRDEPLYDAWLQFARLDASPWAMGLKGVADMVAGLPRQPLESIACVLKALAVPDAYVADYCHAALLDIGGWATRAQDTRPRHKVARGRADIEDLLAIRLAWELILFRATQGPRLGVAWQTALQSLPPTPSAHMTPDVQVDSVLQTALELGYRRRLVADLAACGERPDRHVGRGRVAVQAVFCMNNRLEVFRRALEAVAPEIRTLGFSGFCGLAFAGAPFDPFMGVVRHVMPFAQVLRQGAARGQAPAIADGDRCAVASAMLRFMSLTDGFARLVLLVDHGPLLGHTPQGVGSSGGEWAGGMDARTVAALLNDRALRARLVQEGIAIPADTGFVAARYHSARDEVVLFDTAPWETTHAQDLEGLRAVLEEAGAHAREERIRAPAAPAFGVQPESDAARWRPQERLRGACELEFVGNAAFIAAPRARTEGVALDGRAFLQDYEWRRDADFEILRYIMTVPMMAAHWMNMGYYASVVDHKRFGGANKTLHNRVGGCIGVLEGAGGDLSNGLPIQSLFDGRHWAHEPMRLNAFVEAPRARMDEVLACHEIVRSVVEHGWLFLFQMDSEAGGLFLRARDGRWEQVS
ncbi:MAG: putative inorganic carbon transporter subunit DabA [Acidiferrobacter sp.]